MTMSSRSNSVMSNSPRARDFEQREGLRLLLVGEVRHLPLEVEFGDALVPPPHRLPEPVGAEVVARLGRPTEKSLLSQDILSYLLTHTAAEDTVEGIVEWWLLEEKIKRRTKEVQRALDELVAERLIVARESKDSKIHYRLNKRKLNRIRAILRSELAKR